MLTVSSREVSGLIEARVPFNTYGALSATTACESFGYLPKEFHADVCLAEYVVYSYATPIAWHGPDGWTRPEVKYSVTTSKHQGKCPRTDH